MYIYTARSMSGSPKYCSHPLRIKSDLPSGTWEVCVGAKDGGMAKGVLEDVGEGRGRKRGKLRTHMSGWREERAVLQGVPVGVMKMVGRGEISLNWKGDCWCFP